MELINNSTNQDIRVGICFGSILGTKVRDTTDAKLFQLDRDLYDRYFVPEVHQDDNVTIHLMVRTELRGRGYGDCLVNCSDITHERFHPEVSVR